MNANNKAVAVLLKGTSRLVRPRYSPGLLLRDDDLRLAVEYTRELNRLMFRSLFGCGVVCGLNVEKLTFSCDKLKVTVTEGVALDCHGDPIHVPQTQEIVLDMSCDQDTPPEDMPGLWVEIRNSEKCCAPRTAVCSSEEDETSTVCTREKDGYEIRVTTDEPKCACWCPEGGAVKKASECKCVDPTLPCYTDHYAGKCGCTCGDCADCDCEWVVLASLKYMYEKNGDKNEWQWKADHLFRRFVRPVLMRDPWSEPKPDTQTANESNAAAEPPSEARAYTRRKPPKPSTAS